MTGNFVDVGSGVNGTLRADYNGSDIYLSDPTTLRYFNTDAFSIPASGTFGNAARNLIIGPGSHNLNMNLSKNVNFGRTRGVNIRVQASNVLNTVQFSSIDTVGQLADLRSGDGGPPDAVRAADSPFQILIMLEPCSVTRAVRDRARALDRGARDVCLAVIGALRRRQSVQRRPTFRAGVELIYVNVVVRDGSGNIVRNLKTEDFTLVEDDKTQAITAFDFEEVPSEAIAAAEPAEPVQPILKAEAAPKPAAAAPAAAPVAASKPESIDLKNRRLIVLLFDSSSMQPEELERAIASGYDYISKRLTPADLVADCVGGLDAADRPGLHRRPRGALGRARSVLRGGHASGSRKARRPTGEETEADGFVADDSEFNIFNTDRRLAAIEQLSDTLAPIQQKKSIVYFSSGMTAARRGQSGPAARRHRPRGQGQRVDLSRRHARPDGDRAGRRGQPGERPRRLVDVLGTRRLAAVRQPGREPGHARRARERHRRQGVPRHERLRRRLHEGHRRYVGVLPARLLQHQPRARRTLPAHQGAAQQVRASRSSTATAITRTATSCTRARRIASVSCRIS